MALRYLIVDSCWLAASGHQRVVPRTLEPRQNVAELTLDSGQNCLNDSCWLPAGNEQPRRSQNDDLTCVKSAPCQRRSLTVQRVRYCVASRLRVGFSKWAQLLAYSVSRLILAWPSLRRPFSVAWLRWSVERTKCSCKCAPPRWLSFAGPTKRSQHALRVQLPSKGTNQLPACLHFARARHQILTAA